MGPKRQQAHYDEAADTWHLARHEDAMHVLRDPALFSSRFGTAPDEHRRSELLDERKVEGSEFILTTDPPRHTELRRMIGPVFSKSAVSRWDAIFRRIIRETFESTMMDEPIDACDALAHPISIAVICNYLGIPEDDGEWIRATTAKAAPSSTTDDKDVAIADLEAYFTKLLDIRKADPGDDVLSTIATTPEDELSHPSKLMFCVDLFAAGDEPTASIIAGAIEAFLVHPDELAILRGDNTLVPNAVDELIRWVSPVRSVCRTAMHDTPLGESAVIAGSYVDLDVLAANRDPSVWASPERFDVTRDSPAKHIAFGKFAHSCVGAGLVRLVLRIFLEELATRASSITTAGLVVRRENSQMPFITSLPVVLHSN